MKVDTSKIENMTEIDKLSEVESTITEQIWSLVKRLTEESYDSIDKQLDDLVRIGELARSVKEVRSARSRLRF
jgi:hypothetical protein